MQGRPIKTQLPIAAGVALFGLGVIMLGALVAAPAKAGVSDEVDSRGKCEPASWGPAALSCENF